ncbi:hypothetical protein HDU85_004766 [Gaertneriomyces sp. JEL0708]|nr:hypothetical protein HDU85_004766 [Gaertneriomyces sp. JEL0708]
MEQEEVSLGSAISNIAGQQQVQSDAKLGLRHVGRTASDIPFASIASTEGNQKLLDSSDTVDYIRCTIRPMYRAMRLFNRIECPWKEPEVQKAFALATRKRRSADAVGLAFSQGNNRDPTDYEDFHFCGC